jgi:hypothetical protein
MTRTWFETRLKDNACLIASVIPNVILTEINALNTKLFLYTEKTINYYRFMISYKHILIINRAGDGLRAPTKRIP